MIVDLNTASPSSAYFQMTQTIVPRPIAWVLSENETGTYNLAPFSYFNAVCSDPPLIMLSIGLKPDRQGKDTRVNIQERNHFTLHIASVASLQNLNLSAGTLDKNHSELELLDSKLIDFDGGPLPRLEECKVAFACTHYDSYEIGNAKQMIVIGQIQKMYIDDEIVDVDARGRIKVHTDRLQPLSRLGAGEYMSFGDVIELVRPE